MGKSKKDKKEKGTKSEGKIKKKRKQRAAADESNETDVEVEEEDQEQYADENLSTSFLHPPPGPPDVNEATIELWKSIFELEKNKFSFFDQLFTKGYVVDSLEVMSQGASEGEHFIEAEKEDFEKKTDYGRVVFKTKHVYTGNFEDWYFTGPGRYVWVDGTTYEVHTISF
jgi:hypothetical protein